MIDLNCPVLTIFDEVMDKKGLINNASWWIENVSNFPIIISFYFSFREQTKKASYRSAVWWILAIHLFYKEKKNRNLCFVSLTSL
jgi:hypothetical protein